MQHTEGCVGGGSVANEAQDEDPTARAPARVMLPSRATVTKVGNPEQSLSNVGASRDFSRDPLAGRHGHMGMP